MSAGVAAEGFPAKILIFALLYPLNVRYRQALLRSQTTLIQCLPGRTLD